MFLKNPPNEDSVQLLITTHSEEPVTVVVTAPKFPIPNGEQTVIVTKDAGVTVELSGEIRALESGISSKGILIRATDLIAVNSLNPGSCSSYLALPANALGTEYYSSTWWSLGAESALGIVAGEDNTVVTVKLTEDLSVNFDGTPYGDEATIEIELDAYEVAQILSGADLSGLYINSNKKVAVFSGNSRVSVYRQDGLKDHVAIQLTPVSSWGENFILNHIPEGPEQHLFQVHASEDGTPVYFDGKLWRVLDQGEFDWNDPLGKEPLLLTSEKPVMVVQFAQSQPDNNNTAPTAILVPPMEQYKSEYYFTTPDLGNDAVHYVLLAVAEADTENVLLDDVLVEPDTEWTLIEGTDPEMYGSQMRIEEGNHHILQRDRTNDFIAYVYGVSPGYCTYGFPAGMFAETLRIVSKDET